MQSVDADDRMGDGVNHQRDDKQRNGKNVEESQNAEDFACLQRLTLKIRVQAKGLK